MPCRHHPYKQGRAAAGQGSVASSRLYSTAEPGHTWKSGAVGHAGHDRLQPVPDDPSPSLDSSAPHRGGSGPGVRFMAGRGGAAPLPQVPVLDPHLVGAWPAVYECLQRRGDANLTSHDPRACTREALVGGQPAIDRSAWPRTSEHTPGDANAASDDIRTALLLAELSI